MLLSMTGFGEARFQSEELTLSVEVRSVNNRHLKMNVRGTEPYPMLEPELEKIVRRWIRRGTVLIYIRCDRNYRPHDFRINPVAFRSYVEQIHNLCVQNGWSERENALLGQIINLPGVAPEPGSIGRPSDSEMDAVEKTLDSALKNLNRMRSDEGRAMAAELLLLHNRITGHLDRIRSHMPVVTSLHRTRLRERVCQVLNDSSVQVNDDHLLREVAIFAERCDVAEEVVRMSSHLDQLHEVVTKGDDSPGRKLDFLTQELAREANTTGSKAGDVVISRSVVDIKTTLEKVRELVQNIE